MIFDSATLTAEANSLPVTGSLMKKINLIGLSFSDLEAKVMALGLPKFRARQLWRWVWRHGLTNFDEMSDLGKPVRELLGLQFSADRLTVDRRDLDIDTANLRRVSLRVC